jgi:uncharacterized protein YutD
MKKSVSLSNRNLFIIIDGEQLFKLSKDEIKLKIFFLKKNIRWKMLHSVTKISRLPHFIFSLKNIGCIYLTEDIFWHIEKRDGTYINTNNIEDIFNIL